MTTCPAGLCPGTLRGMSSTLTPWTKAWLLAAALAGLPLAAPAQPADLFADAVRQGVALSQPLTVEFSWQGSPADGHTGAVAQALLAARFEVSYATTRTLEKSTVSHTLSGRWNGIVQPEQMALTVARVNELTRGVGTVNWTIRQSRP